MTTSELMKAMADAGAPFEAILIAVQALDAKDAEIAERDREQAEKRAKDAERKRLDRASGKFSRRRPRTIHGRSKECPPDPPIEDHTPLVSSDEETSRPSRKRKAAVVLATKPTDVTDRVWRDFTGQRKTPVTETAMDGINAEAAKAGWTVNAALAEAVARGWQSFKASWVAEDQRSTGPPGNVSYLDTLLAKQAATT
jgi:hypothetical protein